MKKVLFILATFAIVLVASTPQYSVHDSVSNDLQEVVKFADEAPQGTVYGVTSVSNNNVIVSTPIGDYSVDKTDDGYYSIFGIKGKVISHRGNVYVIDSSFGKWEINTSKCTIKKL